MRVLYGDVYFLLNFCMDYIALLLSAKYLHLKTSWVRLLLAAAGGGIYAVVSVLCRGNFFIGVLITVSVSALMCFVAYGGSSRALFLRVWAVFVIVSLLLGGIVTLLYRLLGSLPYTGKVQFDTPEKNTLLFAMIAGAGYWTVRWAMKMRGSGGEGKSAEISIRFLGKKTVLNALVDSGNLVHDPISGRLVIIVQRKACETILPDSMRKLSVDEPGKISDLPPLLRRRIRIIPVHGIGGDRLLLGLLPDSIEVGFSGKTRRRVDALIALDSDTGSGYGGFCGIVPLTLVA